MKRFLEFLCHPSVAFVIGYVVGLFMGEVK